MSMSMSFRKDRVRVVAVCTVPNEYISEMTSNAGGKISDELGAFLKLSVVQRNTLKLEVSFANEAFAQTGQALGLQKPQLNCMVVVEAENLDKINEIVNDQTFQKYFQGVTQANLFNTSSSVVFSADTMTCIEK
ncbi:hypothetical protein C8R46DRAFT_1355678 [Mycena filopes]|nr:hypothetical protein C8R46DRAFT_1355678 [Mycena filopes]